MSLGLLTAVDATLSTNIVPIVICTCINSEVLITEQGSKITSAFDVFFFLDG